MRRLWRELNPIDCHPIQTESDVSEMVERVARALHASQGRPPAVKWGINLQSWDALLPMERDAFTNAALTAIEAMREPTEIMIEAGHVEVACVQTYRAMIDAALAAPKGE